MIFDGGVLISEIFYSIQGEGGLTGVPSVFIRTSGCNLRCNWCDTMYASWNPEGEDLAIKEIVAKVDALPQARHVVLTGGEPMIAREIRTLARELRERGKHITIETAATVAPEGIDCDLASLSPKLSNSAPDERLSAAWCERHEQTRLQPLVIRKWIEHYNYQLKFVVSSGDDLREIEDLLQQIGTEIPPSKVLLMPEGITTEVLRGRDETLIEVCKKTG